MFSAGLFAISTLTRCCRSRCYLLTIGLLVLFSAQRVGASVYEGFGATTPGGSLGTVVHVTTRANTGPGSLREALKFGNRTIVFDVAGEILLADEVDVRGPFVTIDGFSAPPPGITLVGNGVRISGSKNAHDVIVRGIRVRQANGDGISVRDGAYNVVIDHVSVQGATDESISVTQGAFDVTIQWSLMAEGAADHNFLSLIEYGVLRVTVHHNAYIRGQSRNPHSGWDGTLVTSAPDIVTDIRNNLIWWFLEYGTSVVNNSKANVVNNLYYSALQPSADRALHVRRGGKVYARGNVSPNGSNVDSRSNTKNPFLAAPVQTADACTAAQEIVDDAGVWPRDSIDQHYLSLINLSSAPCGNAPAGSTSPTGGKEKGKKE